MTSYQKSDVPEHYNYEFFKKTLETGLRADDIEVLDWTIKNLTVGGENYCSNIYRAIVKYRKAHCQDARTKTIIIKSLPKDKQTALSRLNIYSKETVFYLDVKPKMEVLMWHTEEPWRLAAQYYFSTTDPEETIVFQDLCEHSFELKSRQVGLDVMHATLVMKKLAQFHALSMKIVEKVPNIITERYPFGLLNTESIKADAFKALFGAQLLKLISLVKECSEFGDVTKKLLRYYDNFTERVFQSVYPLKGETNVLNHGDLWVNNIFFKYDAARRNIKEVRFIDFQLCYYGSLGFDINYFLYTSVQLNVLKNHRHALIETYFETLSKTLEKLNYEQAIPTYEAILQEIQQREAYGFFVAFGFFPIMTMIAMDSQDNSLEKLYDEHFARQKIELMFTSNPRTMETLKYILKRLDQIGVLE